MSKILICEPEEGIRESLKLILCDHYDLILTDHPSQCLDCLANAKDIGLMITSTDILKKIKGKVSDVKVIAVGGYKKASSAGDAGKLGAFGYFGKPFKTDEILPLVQSALG